MDCITRSACPSDAQGISRIIFAALRDTNAKDYSEAVIARVERSFSPAAVSELLTRRQVFVALDQDTIVGTASLDDRVVRTVFVDLSSRAMGLAKP